VIDIKIDRKALLRCNVSGNDIDILAEACLFNVALAREMCARVHQTPEEYFASVSRLVDYFIRKPLNAASETENESAQEREPTYEL
jgi:hypothetical protein